MNYEAKFTHPPEGMPIELTDETRQELLPSRMIQPSSNTQVQGFPQRLSDEFTSSSENSVSSDYYARGVRRNKFCDSYDHASNVEQKMVNWLMQSSFRKKTLDESNVGWSNESSEVVRRSLQLVNQARKLESHHSSELLVVTPHGMFMDRRRGLSASSYDESANLQEQVVVTARSSGSMASTLSNFMQSSNNVFIAGFLVLTILIGLLINEIISM